ncbi:MAG: hypothetical protein SFV23_13665 [Planctomycetaceae bacterium]|nr:hypothetical protein [Planctomycetaceae bacterium]
MTLLGRRPSGFTVGTLMVAAVAVRLVAAYFWRSDSQTDPDVYVALARQIAHGPGLCTPGTDQPTAYRPPGYPLLLAATLRVTGVPSHIAIPGWNLVFDVVVMLSVWAWLRSRSSNLGSSILAMGILGFDPLMVRYVPLPMTEAGFTACSTAAVLLLSRIVDASFPVSDRRSGALWGAAGFLLGLAALCRPSIWPFIGVFSAAVLIGGASSSAPCSSWKRRCFKLMLLWLCLAATVSPWVLRNQLVLGKPILTTTHGGYTLLLANNPVFYDEVARQPWGTVWSGESLQRWQTAMLAAMDAELGSTAGEFDKDRWQGAAARRHIHADPAGFLAGMWYRCRSFWSLSPRGPAEGLPRMIRWSVSLWYVVLFGLAFAGSVTWWRQHVPGLWVLLLYIGCLQGVHLAYWTDTRMRMAIHPLLAILATGVLPQRKGDGEPEA